MQIATGLSKRLEATLLRARRHLGSFSVESDVAKFGQPALVALRTFLAINGYGIDASQEERAAWIISLSEGVSIEQLAAQVRAALTVPAPASEEG